MQTINISIDIPVSCCTSAVESHPAFSDLIDNSNVRSDTRTINMAINEFCKDIVRQVVFSKPTKNNIINGTFTKIIMTFPYATTIGMYINTPIVANRKIVDSFKTTIFSSKFSNSNISLFKTLSTIESQIIDKFKITHNSLKMPVYSLKEHLYNSSIKIFNNRESNHTALAGTNPTFTETYSDTNNDYTGSYETDLYTQDPITENGYSTACTGSHAASNVDNTNLSQLIRISGVWESSSSVGIIYKFLETRV